jgi:hypothetical protein
MLQFQLSSTQESAMASRLPQTSDPRKHNRGGDLVFVSLSHPGEIKNRDNQRAIRSRAMRDIGRSRRTRKKRPQQVTFELTKTVIVDDTASTTYAPHIPASLESWPFPVELDSRAKELVSFSTCAHLPIDSNSVLTQISELGS